MSRLLNQDKYGEWFTAGSKDKSECVVPIPCNNRILISNRLLLVLSYVLATELAKSYSSPYVNMIIISRVLATLSR